MVIILATLNGIVSIFGRMGHTYFYTELIIEFSDKRGKKELLSIKRNECSHFARTITRV